MENNTKKNEGISFNLMKYVTTCIRSWYIFLACIVLCAGLLVTYVAIKTPAVEVEASLMLKEGGGGSSFMLGEIARSFSIGDMFGGSSTTDNESALLKSHTVFLRTVKDLGLNTMYSYRRFGFRWVPLPTSTPIKLISPENASDTISTPLLFMLTRESGDKWSVVVKDNIGKILKEKSLTLPTTLSTPYGKFTLEKTKYYKTKNSEDISKLRILFMSDVAAADVYQELVNIYVPDRKADFINLSFVTPDAKFGKTLLDEIIRNYTDVANVYKTDVSNQSLDLVNQRLEKLVDELSVSEQDLEKFKLANNLTDVEVDAKYLMTKTGELETALLQAQTQYEVVKLTRDFISNPKNNFELIPELIPSVNASGESAPTQIGRYNEMILERMQLLSDAKSNSQVVKKLDEQIDAMRANIISSVNRMYENSRLALNDLKSENAKTKSRVGELPVIERKYITLKRDNMLMEQMYLFLLQQREELNMSISTRSFPAQIVDPPHVLSQGTGMTMAMAGVAGSFLGIILAMAIVYFLKMKKAPVKSLSEFELLNNAPSLGLLKKANSDDRFLVTDNHCANAETMRQLRSQVQDALKSCAGKTVAVTSLNDKEGKTYIATNLAVLLAKVGARVLLFDCNMRCPGVAAALGIKGTDAALVDYVHSDGKNQLVTVEYTVDKYSSLDVATATVTEDNPADILGAEVTRVLFNDLKSGYDYIVIDASSIKGYSDSSYITDLADITLIVERAGVVCADDIEEVNGYYDRGELKRIGVVANSFS